MTVVLLTTIEPKNKFWKHSDLHIWGNYAEYIYLELFSQRSPVFHCKQGKRIQSQLEKILRLQTSTQKNWVILTSHEIENLLFLLESWTAPSQVQTTIPENIVLLRTYLEHHFQTSFSLDEMAKFSGMSKYHLCREFKNTLVFLQKNIFWIYAYHKQSSFSNQAVFPPAILVQLLAFPPKPISYVSSSKIRE